MLKAAAQTFFVLLSVFSVFFGYLCFRGLGIAVEMFGKENPGYVVPPALAGVLVGIFCIIGLLLSFSGFIFSVKKLKRRSE